MIGGCRHFQIGYVVREIDAGLASFECLGADRLDRIIDMRDDTGKPVMIRNLAHLMMGGVEIELIEPRDDWPSVYRGCLRDGETIALHHHGFLVEDDEAWDAAIADLGRTGAPIVMEVDIPRVRVRYFDTRERIGHYLEVVQRRSSA